MAHTIEDRIIELADQFCPKNDNPCYHRNKAMLIEFAHSLGIDLNQSTYEIESILKEASNISINLSDKIDALHNRYPEVSFAKLCRIVVAATKWQKTQTTDKAIQWIKDNGDSHTWYNEMEGESGITDSFIEELKKEIL